MKTQDFTSPVTARQLNETMFKKFGVKVDFEKYTREDLENYRNLLRTKISQHESKGNFNELLTNEAYQKDKYLVSLLNTRIKEMLGESIAVMERKLSGSKKLPAKGNKIGKDTMPVKEGGASMPGDQYLSIPADQNKLSIGQQMARDGITYSPDKEDELIGLMSQYMKKAGMSSKQIRYYLSYDEDFISDQLSDLPKQGSSKGVAEDKKTMSRAAKGHEKYGKQGMQALAKAGKEGKDLDPVRKKYDKYDESAKPDFLDMDKDGDKKEPMKKAVSDKKKNPFAKKDESVEEGFPTVADAKARHEKEKTTGKFDKKDVGTGTQYTRKSSTFDNGTEDKPKEKKVKEGSKNLPGKQEKLDVDKDGKLEKSDFAKLRAGKKKMKESQHKQNVKIVNESVLQLLNEDEEGKAKTITAGADMVNDFTSWMTRIGQYQTKSMIELADTIRANFGQNESEQFKGAVAPALETALNTLTQCREEISNAVAVLAGEATANDTMGSDMGGNMDMAGSEEIPDAGMDSMNAGDEFGASDAASGGGEISGRTQRESRELFARKLSEAHSIIGRLSK
jgi:hypothetical protein